MDADVCEILEKVQLKAIEEGRELSWAEAWLATYEEIFQETVRFEYDLSEDAIVEIMVRCLGGSQKRISEMSKTEFLKLQYECQFGESGDFIGDYCSPIHTEEQLVTVLRDCLAKGKPYELSEDVRRLMEQGVEF